MTLKPKTGLRDTPSNGNVSFHVSGDFLAPGDVSLLGGPSAAWDVYDAVHELTIFNSSGVDSDGTFSFDLEVPWQLGPDKVRPGQHNVIVCAGITTLVPDDICVSRPFTIPAPKVSLSRTSGRPSELITAHGSGFAPAPLDEEIRVVFAGTTIAEELFPSSTFDMDFNVP